MPITLAELSHRWPVPNTASGRTSRRCAYVMVLVCGAATYCASTLRAVYAQHVALERFADRGTPAKNSWIGIISTTTHPPVRVNHAVFPSSRAVPLLGLPRPVSALLAMVEPRLR